MHDFELQLLREILVELQKLTAISLASSHRLKDIDIELSAQGKTLEEILEAIEGPQAQSAKLVITPAKE